MINTHSLKSFLLFFSATTLISAIASTQSFAATQPIITPLAERPIAPPKADAIDAKDTKIGMFYLIWHCSFSQASRYVERIYDMTEIMRLGGNDWGPEAAFHWTGQPQAGYYCGANDDALLKKHAEQIRDLGVDFVYVDATNQDFVVDSATEPTGSSPWESYVRFVWWQQKTFEKMVQIWSEIPGAPKIVPWTRISSEGPHIDFMLDVLKRHPHMFFIYDGKPLIMTVPEFSDPARVESYASQYTIRHMWTMIEKPWNNEAFAKFLNYYSDPEAKRKEFWSYQEACEDHAGFNQSGALIACKQRSSKFQGKVEQISVTLAVQIDWMSNKYHATSKYGGRTLRRQFETLLRYQNEARILTITGWNEWGAQRGRCPATMSNCTEGQLNHNDGTPIFVDQFGADFNRDAEAGGLDGDWYVRELKELIADYRSGQLTIEAPPSPNSKMIDQAASFNEYDYLAMYPDVRQKIREGLFSSGKQHFNKVGRYEGRNPNVLFSDLAYRQANPRVQDQILAGKIISGFAHFLKSKKQMGKFIIPAFDEKRYLKQNPDVAAAVKKGSYRSGLHHYFTNGRKEKRAPALLKPLLRYSMTTAL